MNNFEVKNGYVTIYKGNSAFMQNQSDKVVMPVSSIEEIMKEINPKEEIILKVPVIKETKAEKVVEKEPIKKNIDKKKRK